MIAGAPAFAMDVSEPIELTEEEDINAAAEVLSNLEALGDKVSACADSEQAADECICQNPEELNALQEAYDNAIITYPEWEGASVEFQFSEEHGSGALSFKNIAENLESVSCN